MALTGALLPLVITALALLAYSRLIRPHPQGPKPLPIIGNVFDPTPKELWLTAFKWARTCGPITHIRIFNKCLVFLNTPKAVFDLLDKRRSVYSDKPHLVMAGELCGCENMVAFTSYGNRARRQTKLMQKAFGPAVITRWRVDLLEQVGRGLIRTRYAGGLLDVYGHQVKSNDDPLLNLAEECVDILANRIAIGGGIDGPSISFPLHRNLHNGYQELTGSLMLLSKLTFPVPAKHLPLWFHGASFERNTTIWKEKWKNLKKEPLDPPKSLSSFDASFESSSSSDSSSNNTKVAENTAIDDHVIRWTANCMYSGSIDTTIKTLSHFILALQNPHVLQHTQAELDDVLGSSRIEPSIRPGIEFGLRIKPRF
ncbi:cytochrome P450 [Suillus lakei]|nr:cytochrome P450 [Suillus lakei]